MSTEFDAMDDGLQEPENPIKKKKEGMSMPMMIGIGVGALVLNIVIIIVLVKFVFNGNSNTQNDKKGKTSHSKASEEESSSSESNDEEKEFFENEEKRKFLELGRITTNPKGANKFVVVSVGCVYREKGEIKKEDLKPESEFMRKLLAKSKSVIINEIGSTTVEEIQNKRPNLESIFRDRLKPVFKERQLFLREVIINEFILQ